MLSCVLLNADLYTAKLIARSLTALLNAESIEMMKLTTDALSVIRQSHRCYLILVYELQNSITALEFQLQCLINKTVMLYNNLNIETTFLEFTMFSIQIKNFP